MVVPATGRTTGITNYTGTVGYTYDELGCTTEVTSPQGTLAFTYNDLGQRTSMTLPGNRTVSYSYDATTADLATITDWSTAPGPTEYGWTDDGRIASITRPTGTGTPAEDIVSTYAYDAAGRLTGISHSQNGSYLAEFGYTLDANGNRTQVDITGTALPNGFEAYTYNSLDQLTYAKYVDGGTATFGYDANGNRTSVSAGGVTTSYTYDDLGQLTAISGGIAIAYDNNGNRISVTDNGTVMRTYTWDWDNRLTEATVNGITTSSSYLGDDTRASTTVGATTTDYLVDRTVGMPCRRSSTMAQTQPSTMSPATASVSTAPGRRPTL